MIITGEPSSPMSATAIVALPLSPDRQRPVGYARVSKAKLASADEKRAHILGGEHREMELSGLHDDR